MPGLVDVASLRSCRGYGFFDSTGLPGLGGLDEGRKDRAGQSAVGAGTLRMPLNGNDKVGGRIQLNGLDYAVFRRHCTDKKIIAGNLDGLVVA